MTADELAALMGPVAREILGEPNARLSSAHELRYGTHGSLSIDLRKGTYYDNEAQAGGGVLDFIGVRTGLSRPQSFLWLEQHGFRVGTTPPHQGNGKHRSKQPRRIAQTFDYCDEAGHLLFQVVKFEPKGFAQRRPDGSGGWIWNLDDTRRVPYRLRELQQSISEGEDIFIVEGEKDADLLRAEGIAATTSPGGAGKWPDDFDRYFELASRVIIIPDHDEPGHKHARMVGAALKGTAERVVVLELPGLEHKEDVSDWYAVHGGTTDKLFDLVLEARPYEQFAEGKPETPDLPAMPFFDAAEFEGVPLPLRRWLVLGRIPMRNVTLLSGDGAVGKTTIALQLAVSVAAARNDWLGGLINEPGGVLFFTAEEERDEVHYRVDAICRHYAVPFTALATKFLLNCAAGEDCVLATTNKLGLLDETLIYKTLRQSIRQHKPKLVILESAADVFGGNENDRAQVRQFVRMLRAIAIEADCAVVLLSHPSQAGMASGKGTSGTTAWNNSVRSRLYFTRPDDDEEDGATETDERELTVMKANFAAAGETVKCTYSEGVFVLPGSVPQHASANRRKIAEDVFLQLLTAFTAQGRPTSPSPCSIFAPALFAKEAAARAQKLKPNELRDAMSRMLEAGTIESVLEGPPSKRRPRLQPKGRQPKEDSMS